MIQGVAYKTIVCALEDVYCRSLDIRNSPTMAFQDKDTNDKWPTLANCTVMEGDFSVSMITSTNYTHESFPVFERLRVITGHLLVFQVSALRSLKRMFPNLRIIGGQELIMNYALVVYQNTHLVEVGLPKLTRIINGGVRIMDNTQLCYSRYIDWEQILIGPANDILTDQNKGSNSGSCNDDCSPKNEERCHKLDNALSCWDAETCQLECKYTWNDDRSVGPGCDDNGAKCHEQCLGGCISPKNASACNYCRNVNYRGRCVASCPAGFYVVHHVHLIRRCVTIEECHKIAVPMTAENNKKQMLIVENMCRVDCPSGQQIDPKNSSRCMKCFGYCPVKCKGDTIDSLGRINDLLFKKCNVIEGYLEIELRSGLDTSAIEKVGEALGNIEVIEGYLLIDFSTSFISLHMFKRLRLIKGNVLWRERYALAVFENPNLRQVFDFEKQPLEIGNGTVLFQNNRMLCYNRIKALIDSIGLLDVKENDVSYYSNGDRAICNETTFEVRTEDAHSSGFMVSWIAFNTTDMDHRKFLGYQVFYKKVDGPDSNMSIDDDRSACSDSWQMHFEPEKGNGNEGLNRGALIFGIESNTWYAYYVQTKLINHPGARNAISKIKFVKTLYSTPDPPRDILGRSLLSKSDQIDLSWELPERPNGDITHYMVKWQVLEEDVTALSSHVCEDKTGVSASHSKEMAHRSTFGGKSSKSPTCSRESGCCECEPVKLTKQFDLSAEEAKTSNEADFENAVQNLVFVQHTSSKRTVDVLSRDERVRRSVSNLSGQQKKLKREKVNEMSSNNKTSNSGERILQLIGTNGVQKLLVTKNDLNETLTIYRSRPNNATHTINVTTRRLSIVGLKHFTQYQIWIYACQNISAPGGAYCSQRPGWLVVRTTPIPLHDLVDNSTIEVVNSTDTQDWRSRKITWQEPQDPNGVILAYRVTVVAEDRAQTPISQCVEAKNFRRRGGVTFNWLAEGEYMVQVETISSASLSIHAVKEVAIAHGSFSIVKATIFTWKVMLLSCAITILSLIATALVIYYFSRRLLGEKMREYVRQQISANPEYLSQMEVYKPDMWELRREDIVLLEEIGRGTFGKVFRGIATDVLSFNGIRFGECAVKTVAETASCSERIHFLVEASVMKQFDTAFIVKLFGVVSDGQPVLVVMELMRRGNLRDYLRSRRPDVEENTDNLPVPNQTEFTKWALQIADGMAYLESLRFCHRDLAARNCMVNEFNAVKIGDFGMARDIYYQEYYKPAGKRLMPVRWMAPESLMDGKFTIKSDVWSYGIVLYEMLTLAQQPYLGIASENVFDYIGVKKKILARPTNCPEFWYDLMVKCWKYDPRERPSFNQIVHHLLRYADFVLPFFDEEFRKLSFVLSEGDNVEPNLDYPIFSKFTGQNSENPRVQKFSAGRHEAGISTSMDENELEMLDQRASVITNNNDDSEHDEDIYWNRSSTSQREQLIAEDKRDKIPVKVSRSSRRDKCEHKL